MRNKHSLTQTRAHAHDDDLWSAVVVAAAASASTRTSDQTKQRTPACPSLPGRRQSPQSPPSLPGQCCCYLHPRRRRRRRKSDTEWGYGENMWNRDLDYGATGVLQVVVAAAAHAAAAHVVWYDPYAFFTAAACGSGPESIIQ